MNRCKHMKVFVSTFCMMMITILGGCQSKENADVDLTPKESTTVETITDNNTFSEEFDITRLYYKERKTVSNQFVIDENGVLWGTGVNDFGQLGIEPVNADLKEYVESIKIAEDVLLVDASDNGYFTIYLTNNGELYGIGSNMLGLLKQPYTECYSEYDYLTVTEPVLLMEDVKYASAGREAIVALKNDGSVWWWGQYCSTYLTNSYADVYKLFWKADEDDVNPVKMLKNSPTKLLDDCVYVTTGDFRGAAITSSGELYVWGLNLFGECGVEVGEDDYIRVPTKVLDGTKMVWVERMDNRDKGIYDTTNYGTKYSFNVFVQTFDDKYLASGKNLGTKEKTIQLTGDIYEPSTEKYSDEFVPIKVEEYSEEGCRLILNELQWNDSIEKVEEILSEHHINYWKVIEPVENSENEMAIYSIDVNCSDYLIEFDQNGMYKIVMQTGGSRNMAYSFGMKLDEIKKLIPCELELDIEENEYIDIYHTAESIDGRFYSFVFEENDGELIRIEESYR